MLCAIDARLWQTRSRAAHQEARHRLATEGAEGLERHGLMIDKREIIEAASSFSLLFNVVGKEIMSWAGYSPHRYGVPHLVVAKVEILAGQGWRRTNAVQLQDHLL
jgi:hypothetical protein